MEPTQLVLLLNILAILLAPAALFLIVLRRQAAQRAERAERLLDVRARAAQQEVFSPLAARLTQLEQGFELLDGAVSQLSRGQQYTIELLSRDSAFREPVVRAERREER